MKDAIFLQYLVYVVACCLALGGIIWMVAFVILGQLAYAGLAMAIAIIGSILATRIEERDKKKIVMLNPAGIFMRDAKNR
jgi:hypothetical protein